MSHVTVTIPLYNHERYINRTVHNVLSQSWPDLDVLVVDDNSQDQSFTAVQTVNDSRLHVIRNDQNLGLARNWNKCLELARGPLVMVFGSDDLLETEYLQKAAEIFRQNPHVGLVFAPVRSIDARDLEFGREPARQARRYAAGDEAVSALLSMGICTVTTIFRRTCYEKLGGYDELIRDGPDVEFCVRIAAHFDIFDLGDIGGAVRVHDAKTGHLSYLRADRLDSYLYGLNRIWAHVSPAGLQRMRIGDLKAHINADGALFASNGALTSLAFGRPDLARIYLRRLVGLDNHWWRNIRYWQAYCLSVFPYVGRRVIRARMKID